MEGLDFLRVVLLFARKVWFIGWGERDTERRRKTGGEKQGEKSCQL